jgi:hypothetical protein
VTDFQKAVLIAIAVGAGLWLVTRQQGIKSSPFGRTGSPNTGPHTVASGNGWLPAFFSTAATTTPEVTGEPETGNIVTNNAFTAGICATGGSRARIGCGCGGRSGAKKG